MRTISPGRIERSASSIPGTNGRSVSRRLSGATSDLLQQLEHSRSLLSRHRGEVVKEIGQALAGRQIVEHRLHRHARAGKDRRPAQNVTPALDERLFVHALLHCVGRFSLVPTHHLAEYRPEYFQSQPKCDDGSFSIIRIAPFALAGRNPTRRDA